MNPAAVASGKTVAFSWEHEPGVSKLLSAARGGAKPPPPAAEEEEKTGGKATTPAASARKRAVLPHMIRVRPPPGAPARSRRGVVRPEEDPFLAAFLACTKRGKATEPKGAQKLLGFSGLGLGSGLRLGLGLSCKGPGGVVESVVRLAKMSELKDD
ncbi:hypothetical protein ABZP36_005743 [Zizania latifolia]